MSKAKTKDELIEEMISVLQVKKAEILKAEKPKWETNCSFKTSTGETKNLNVINDEAEITSFLADLIRLKDSHEKAAVILNSKQEFKWCGFTYQEWEADFKTKIFKIQLTQRKKEVENLQEALDKQISKEKREQMEFDALQKTFQGLI